MDPITITIGIGALVLGATGTYFFTRGNAVGSSHDGTKLDTTGSINNVIVTDIQDKVEVESREVVILLSIICGIKIIEFLIFLYNQRVNGIKKRCEKRQRAAAVSGINV